MILECSNVWVESCLWKSIWLYSTVQKSHLILTLWFLFTTQARRNIFHIGGGGLKGGESEARKKEKMGVRGNCSWPRPLDRWKTPHFWKMCHWRKQRITTNKSLSLKILKFSTCMTSKDIEFLIDSGSFLQYIQVCVFIATILAFTPFFTFKINKLQQIIGGGGLKPPSPPPRFRRACYWQKYSVTYFAKLVHEMKVNESDFPKNTTSFLSELSSQINSKFLLVLFVQPVYWFVTIA